MINSLRQSILMKKKWAEKSYKERVVKSIKEAYKNPEVLKKISIKSKNAWKNMTEDVKKSRSKKISKKLKVSWTKKSQSEKDIIIEKIRQRNIIANKKPEVKKRHSDAMKLKWLDKDFRVKRHNSLLGYKHTDIAKLNMSKAHKGKKKGPQTKKHRENISKAMYKKWKDKEYKKNQLEKILNGQTKIRNLKYKGHYFPSKGELKTAKLLCNNLQNFELIKGITYQINVKNRFFDFLYNKIFIEFHPGTNWSHDISGKEYFNFRRNILNNSEYRDFNLVIIESENKIINTIQSIIKNEA